MLESVSAAASIGGIGRAASPPSSPESTYAADWQTPPAQTAPGATALAPSSRPSGEPPAARVLEAALLSEDVYRDVAAPPPGFSLASEADLRALNLSADMLEQAGSSFRARVYVTGEGAGQRYVVAFRGTTNGEDWINNLRQGTGLSSESYAKALQIGERLARSDANVYVTGHSLGGGLSSAAGLAAGREAISFNAAGLHDGTIAGARGIAAANGRGEAPVDAYRVPGEALTMIQEGGDRWIGGILFGVPGALIVDAPPAYGTHRDLPLVVPEGTGWLERYNPVDRHLIDWVVAGAGRLR